MLKKALLGAVTVILILGLVAYLLYDRMEASYQRWADCVRVNDIYYIAGLVEEFREKRGYYPLGRDYLTPPDEAHVHVQVGVNITHRELPEMYRRVPPGVSGGLLTTEEFIEELSEGLGRRVALPSDPQSVPTGAPNFYQYNIHPNGSYVLSANLHGPNEFTTKLGEQYYKYSVGSFENENPQGRVLDFQRLNVKPEKCSR